MPRKPKPSAAETFEGVTAGGLEFIRRVTRVDGPTALAALIARIDTRRGVLLTSGTETPGRYVRFDLGFADPPLALEARGRDFRIAALNARGAPLVAFCAEALAQAPGVTFETSGDTITGSIEAGGDVLDESERTRRPGVFGVLRALIEALRAPSESRLGLYGAFGYDLVAQLEHLEQRAARPDDQRDLVLFLPDRLLVWDHAREVCEEVAYEFRYGDASTDGVSTDTPEAPFATPVREAFSDHAPGEYVATVAKAKEAFARGDLFEVVPGQLFAEPYRGAPSALFTRLREINPAPYGAFMNLGDGEFLVSASPEMFVRSDGRRLESCPISGTIARGRDALEDAANILKLLNSKKDEYELNMCTDVDRNDKARVCEPGSVRVIGRRQIELYSRLIHTVDHVEGRLRADRDALDGFLTHAWAVTVTGAPKLWAMQFIEDHERSPRRWYGGAIGAITVDGGINTGLTIRTMRLKDGLAEIRAGATLLFDSDPEAEDAECRLKASALVQAVREETGAAKRAAPATPDRIGAGKRILMVDCEDSFVHTLADYLRQTGASVQVVRWSAARAALQADPKPDMVALSPGPGRPDDFQLKPLIDEILKYNLRVFGVCLGMQALGEYFGATLAQLPTPVHGRSSRLTLERCALFEGCPEEAELGRYHSLYLEPATIPDVLEVVAVAPDGAPMAIQHRTLPISAVQFHPESIMSQADHVGLRIVSNAWRVNAPA